MSWTLNGQSSTQLGVKNLQAQHANLAGGQFTFTAEGRDLDQAYLFDHLELVQLSDGAQTRWAGPCIRRPVSGRPGAEGHQYVIADPWWYLAQQTYLQQWKTKGGEEQEWMSRCILGLAPDGATRESLQTMIGHVVNFARDCGWPVSVGSIALPEIVEVEEFIGCKCDEIIRKLLRWAPDAVAWWTFGTTSALNIKHRSALTAQTLTMGHAPLHAVDLSPREELTPGAVVIAFERTDTIDGEEQIVIEKDVAPPGATGREKGAAHFAINLEGGSVTYLKQQIETTPIEAPVGGGGGEAGNKARRYWGARLGLIGRVKTVVGVSPETPEITFELLSPGVYFAREMANPAGADDEGPYEFEDPADEDSDKVRLDAELPRELVKGSVMPWMQDTIAQRQLIRAKLSYTLKDGKKIKKQDAVIKVVATDATTREYSQLDSFVLPEQKTTGLAASMLTALSAAHYQGTVTLLADEVPALPALGHVLHISGGRGEWADMGAVIQQVAEDIDNGTKVLTIGPPEHLEPQDALALQRCNRRPEGRTGNKALNAERRRTGLPQFYRVEDPA